ncbi:MAG: hypothetical protein V3T70_11595 [Phycisphaerae bacterium]
MKIKLDKDLYDRAREFAEKKKFPSVDEFVARLIEKELNTEVQEDDPEVLKRLQGLGYIE